MIKIREVEKVEKRTDGKKLTVQDEKILKILRELEYGKVVITMKKGDPVHVEVQRSIQL